MVKATSDIRVMNLKRKRAEALEHDDEDSVQRQFDVALQTALTFLNHGDPEEPPAAEGPPQNLVGEPAQEPEAQAEEELAEGSSQDFVGEPAQEPVAAIVASAPAAAPGTRRRVRAKKGNP